MEKGFSGSCKMEQIIFQWKMENSKVAVKWKIKILGYKMEKACFYTVKWNWYPLLSPLFMHTLVAEIGKPFKEYATTSDYY